MRSGSHSEADLLRVADIERRIAALELFATLQLELLAELQRELLELKSEALDRSAAGDLGDQAAISDLTTPIDAARGHIGSLILHIRENPEEQADAEGRTAITLRTEAIEGEPALSTAGQSAKGPAIDRREDTRCDDRE